MNSQTPPPPIPPSGDFPPPSPPPPWELRYKPLGSDPDEQVPIHGLFAAVEALLRQPRRLIFQLRQPGGGRLVLSMFLIAALCSLAYGLIAGTFSGGRQLWAAPVKIAGGLLCSGLICLPSLFIFACLGGSQARLVEIAGLVAGLVALLSVLLVGFAPVAWIFSQSTEYLPVVGALHVAFGLVACFLGLRFLGTGFAHSSSTGRGSPMFWNVIFLLVALQMTTALRPIIGVDNTFLPTEKKFFLKHWAECVRNTGAQGQPSATPPDAVQ